MHNGTVKWFNATKGYGFITDDADKSEIFVHFSGINSEGYKTRQQRTAGSQRNGCSVSLSHTGANETTAGF